MFKKVMQYLLITTSVLVVGLWATFFIKQYNNRMAQKEFDLQQSYTAIGNPILAKNNAEYFKLIKSFKDVSQALGIPFVKRSYFQGHLIKQGQVDYSHYQDTVTIESSNLNKSPLERNFHTHFMNNQVYSTSTTSDATHLKKYSAVNFTIRNVIASGTPVTREGYYFIQTKSPQKVTEFKQDLKVNLESKFHRKIAASSMEGPELVKDIPIDTSAQESLAKTFSIFQLALVVIFVLTFSYDIGVYRLLGFTRLEIIKHTLAFPGAIVAVIASLIDIGSVILTRNLQVGVEISIFIVLWLFGQFALSLLTVSILLFFPTNRILVRSNFAKRLFLGLYLGKGVLFTIILSLTLPLTTLGIQYVKTKVISQTTSAYSYKNYAVFFPTSIGYNQDSLINPSSSLKIDNKIVYTLANKKGGLLIDTSSLGQPISAQYKDVTVNPNYLKFNPIQDLHSKKITIPEQVRTPIVLLPSDKKSLESSIKDYYINSLKMDIPKIILMKSKQNVRDSTGKLVKNYSYLNVLTQANKGEYLDILTGDDSDPLKVYLGQKSTRTVYSQYRKTLQTYNLTDNYPQLVRFSVLPLEYLQQAEGNVISDVVLIGTSLALFILLTIASVYVYFAVYGRDFAIMRTLGLSVYRSSRSLWILWGGQLLIAAGFILISGGSDVPTVLIASVGGAFLDGITSVFAVSAFSKSHLRRLINE